MENSVECNNDDMLFFPCEDIVSTSVEDRSIVFAEIESQLVNSNMLEDLENKCAYNKVLREIMIYSLHKKYINRIYQSVLYQLIRERRIREYSRLYHNLISSF